jgi:glutamyl-tRNA(Gln) amidotransferase subunit D
VADVLRALRALPMGQRVELTDADGRSWSGTIVPPHELSGDAIVPLKLESGYNVGVRVGPGSRYHVLGATASPPTRPAAPPARASGGDEGGVVVLTTGGTIASRVDYETGGVRPVHTEAEILEFYPELEKTGAVRVEPVFDRLSENVVPRDWVTLAERSAAALAGGARGVVIAHGTDTLGFTASALSFLLQDLTGPVVLVGAQRSPDRPSSDGPGNLAAAVAVARHAGLGEVVAVMHSGLSDSRFAIHRGNRVRKMHSSRRDAFQTRNSEPLGWVEEGTVHLRPEARPAAGGPTRCDGPIDEAGGLLWSYPGLTPEAADRFSRPLRGVVLAGTGLGHVGTVHLDWIREAVARGTVVAMTTQCLAGEVDPYVYATGRELLRAGVTYLGDLLPETAYTKMLWALGHAADPTAVRALLLQDRAGEFEARHREGAEA